MEFLEEYKVSADNWYKLNLNILTILLDAALPCIRLSMACSFDENSVVNSCILNALKGRHHFNYAIIVINVLINAMDNKLFILEF